MTKIFFFVKLKNQINLYTLKFFLKIKGSIYTRNLDKKIIHVLKFPKIY